MVNLYKQGVFNACSCGMRIMLQTHICFPVHLKTKISQTLGKTFGCFSVVSKPDPFFRVIIDYERPLQKGLV